MVKHRSRDKDPQGYQRDLRRANPSRYLWRSAKGRATRQGLEFGITPEDVVVPTLCPVFGIPLFISDGRHGDNSPSLDRVDSSRGYVQGNIEVISWKANRLKGNATPQELRRLADYYGKKDRESSPAKNKKSPSGEI